MRAAGSLGTATARTRSRVGAPSLLSMVARKGLPYALIAPATVVILGVLGWPLLDLLYLSTQHYGLRELFQHQGRFVGLQNFATILTDPQFKYAVEVTVIFTAVNVALSMTLGTIIALLIERVSSFVRALLGASLVFVWATPVIPAIDLWQWMFDYAFGDIDWLLTKIGV